MKKGTKINQILQQLPPGVVFLSTWLKAQGCPYELQQRYRESGWLITIGKGAMLRNGQKLLISGAIYALQQQAGMKIHIGGRTALGMQGYAHYIEVEKKETLLFAQRGKRLPVWFKNNNWDTKPALITTSFLPQDKGLIDFNEEGITIKISGPARAIMECLYLAPKKFDLLEAYQIMEGLTALHPDDVQILLSNCNSVKTVRLFLYLAHKADHQWIKHLDMNTVFIGKGKRSFVKNGVFIPEFNIVVPAELAKI